MILRGAQKCDNKLRATRIHIFSFHCIKSHDQKQIITAAKHDKNITGTILSTSNEI